MGPDATPDPPHLKVGKGLVVGIGTQATDRRVEVLDCTHEFQVPPEAQAGESMHCREHLWFDIVAPREGRLVMSGGLSPGCNRQGLVAGAPRVLRDNHGICTVPSSREMVCDLAYAHGPTRFAVTKKRGRSARVDGASGRTRGLHVRDVSVERMCEGEGDSVLYEDTLFDSFVPRRPKRGGLQLGHVGEERESAVRHQEGRDANELARLIAERVEASLDGGHHRVTCSHRRRPCPGAGWSPPSQRFDEQRVAAAGNRELARLLNRHPSSSLTSELCGFHLGQRVQRERGRAELVSQLGDAVDSTRKGIRSRGCE